MSIGHLDMSIRPMDEQKCPVDIQRSIGHLAEVLDMHVWALFHEIFDAHDSLEDVLALRKMLF